MFIASMSAAGNEIIISVDVVHSDIPMLLSLESLKKARAKLDVENDETEILGKESHLTSHQVDTTVYQWINQRTLKLEKCVK